MLRLSTGSNNSDEVIRALSDLYSIPKASYNSETTNLDRASANGTGASIAVK